VVTLRRASYFLYLTKQSGASLFVNRKVETAAVECIATASSASAGNFPEPTASLSHAAASWLSSLKADRAAI